MFRSGVTTCFTFAKRLGRTISSLRSEGLWAQSCHAQSMFSRFRRNFARTTAVACEALACFVSYARSACGGGAFTFLALVMRAHPCASRCAPVSPPTAPSPPTPPGAPAHPDRPRGRSSRLVRLRRHRGLAAADAGSARRRTRTCSDTHAAVARLGGVRRETLCRSGPAFRPVPSRSCSLCRRRACA